MIKSTSNNSDFETIFLSSKSNSSNSNSLTSNSSNIYYYFIRFFSCCSFHTSKINSFDSNDSNNDINYIITRFTTYYEIENNIYDPMSVFNFSCCFYDKI